MRVSNLLLAACMIAILPRMSAVNEVVPFYDPGGCIPNKMLNQRQRRKIARQTGRKRA